MKRVAAAVIAVFAVFLLGAVIPQKPMFVESSSPSLGVRVTVGPASAEEYQLLRKRTPPGSYVARANVYDANNQHVAIGEGQVIVSAGQRQSTTTTADGTTVIFTVAVSDDNTRAATEVTAKRGEKIVLHQESDVVLRSSDRTR